MVTTLSIINVNDYDTLLIGTSHGHIYGAIIDYENPDFSNNSFVFLLI